MIRVDETDPVGEIEPSFPYRDVTVRRGIEFKDHYDIQSEIGRGKFGTVYRCKEKKSGLLLAAKVVNTTKKEDRRSVEREVGIMRKLQHPRLIQLYDAIDTGKQIYVVLELIQGGELFERVIDDDFVLTERSCAVFMRQICEGIEFVHSQYILHLDMKPENILCLTKEGNRIKIIDFGLARQYDPTKKLQVLFGTPEFVAPEVVNFDQIGFGTDMWSIGVICYVLLSGLSPFMGDTDLETMANVTIAKYDFDHEAFANISEDAKDFIKCLLVKNIENRATAAQCRAHPWLARKNVPASTNDVVHESTKTPEKRNYSVNEAAVVASKDELDVTKDNLRLFVERWREHPDSPYMIDLNHRVEPEALPLSSQGDYDNISVSLRGHSPSPCGSVYSSSSESTPDNGSASSSLVVPKLNLALGRRASDSATCEKHRDPASQIILAEEIIKLSEHLRSVAINSFLANEESQKSNKDRASFGVNKSSKVETTSPFTTTATKKKTNQVVNQQQQESNEITEKLSNIKRQRKLNGTTFNGSRNYEKNNSDVGSSVYTLKKSSKISKKESGKDDNKVQDSNDRVLDTRTNTKNKIDKEIDLAPPWRKPRTKHRFSEICRDVPRITNLQDLHKSLNLDEPVSTKNLLLQLLEEWEDVTRPSGVGRKSISGDFCGEDSVARRSINSLAEYFQLEQQKSSTPGVTSSSPSSIHR